MSDEAERKMAFLYALRSRGVTDGRVLTAMEKIDRGLFVKGVFADRAYEDMPLPISCGQTISQPSVVGLMTQALEVQPARQGARGRHRVGLPGGGAFAARPPGLHAGPPPPPRDPGAGGLRRARLTNITALTADGSRGYPEQAPFDRILVTAAAEDPPGPLLAQMRVGGIMVVPVGQSDTVQSLIKVTRTEAGYDYNELRPVRFVPLVEGLGQD
jgi:protein-L-isoaspartate(D-aspartate) O-methyltransferase